jgi:hypothetical protein
MDHAKAPQPGGDGPEALIEEARRWQRRRLRRQTAALVALSGLVILGVGAYRIADSGQAAPAPKPRGTVLVAHQPVFVIYEKVETVMSATGRFPAVRETGEIWVSTGAISTYREILTSPGRPTLEVGQGTARDPKFGAVNDVYLYDAKANTIYLTGAFPAGPPPPPLTRSAFLHRLAQIYHQLIVHPSVRVTGTRLFEGHKVYVVRVYAPSSATFDASGQLVTRASKPIATMYYDKATYRQLLLESSGPGNAITTRVLAWRTLPATSANLRLTSLARAHPGVRVHTAPQSIKKLYDEAAQIGGVNGDFTLGPFG